MADDAGETMLTEERLAEIEKREPHIEVAGIVRGGYIIRELLDHIAVQSATIKRLETPVAEGEVAKLEKLYVAVFPGPAYGSLGLTQGQEREQGRAAVIFTRDAMPLLRRQAREIERRGDLLEQCRLVFVGEEQRWDDEQMDLCADIQEGGSAKQHAKRLDEISRALGTLERLRQLAAALSLNSVETREMKP